ncbi:ERF family protein [Pectinatus frisingensis]|uniref:ERF family protein n=1 Tax=Pectinatus frisingensis TaxID=865 RepID=UPI0018C7A0F2|nr:ERF family protein [Pectinatus frisingensis]
MPEGKTLIQKLIKIQSELKAPKNQYNSFGKYHYRSCEDILSAAKPLCVENGILLTISDEIVLIGDRYYVKTIVTVADEGEEIHSTAYAREEDSKKGMDRSQLTGATSSYARKYALNGLFAIDDTKDADGLNDAQNGNYEPKNNIQNKPITHNDKDTKNIILKKIGDKAKKAGLTNKDVTGIIHLKYKKANSTELTIQQCGDMLNNFDKYLDDYIATCGK